MLQNLRDRAAAAGKPNTCSSSSSSPCVALVTYHTQRHPPLEARRPPLGPSPTVANRRQPSPPAARLTAPQALCEGSKRSH